MRALRFGLSCDFCHPPRWRQDPARLYQSIIAQAARAEALGWDDDRGADQKIVSGGRFDLGVGAGYRVGEFRGERFTFDGKYYRYGDVQLFFLPQQPIATSSSSSRREKSCRRLGEGRMRNGMLRRRDSMARDQGCFP